MKKGFLALPLLIAGLSMTTATQARDTEHLLSIEEAMNTPAAQEKLDPEIRFVFADTPHATIIANHGNFVTNKKTNAFNKSDQEACRWVMLSALLSLQDRVQKEGGNAVVNIESYYKQRPMESRSEYECHAGFLMAGVALRGDIVTLP